MNKLRNTLSSVALRNLLKSEERRSNNFVVIGFPKSGTTWTSQLIACAYGYAFTRNKVRFRTRNVLLHTHSIDFEGRKNLLYVVRDPREVVCSAARAAPTRSRAQIFGERGKIRSSFVKHVLDDLPGATCSMRAHLNACIQSDWPFIRFEDLKLDATQALTSRMRDIERVASIDTIEQAVNAFDFQRLKRTSQNDRFLASSSIHSWRELLDEQTEELIRARLGELPTHFGYII